MGNLKNKLLELLSEYNSLGINQQIDYDKFYLYSLITHSTAIEGSTVTEIENQLLFDEGISAKGRSMIEQLMNLDLKLAYEASMKLAKEHAPFSVDMLKGLSALVMKNTGNTYSTLQGSFDSSKGDLRLVNVTAGAGGSSYMNFLKVPAQLENFCRLVNERRANLQESNDIVEKYLLCFDAHYLLVTIHPWVDGNGRMARLIMNHLQFESGLIPTKITKDDKADYIQALIDSREQESLKPFRQFMLRLHINNLQTEINNFKRVNISDPIKLLSDPISVKLYDEISLDGSRSYSEFAKVLAVSEATIKRRLKDIKQLGLIRRVGSNKSGHWEIVQLK